MKKFSTLHMPLLSFFSKELYTDVAMNWRGVNFLYLLLLLAACWIPVMFGINKSFSQFMEDEVPTVVNQVPEINVVNGEASIAEPQPYYIKNLKDNKAFAIIDTTGTITSLENLDATILITKTQVVMRESPHQMRIFSLAGMKNFTLTREKLTQWANIFKKILIIALYPAAVTGSFIFRIIQALIYAAIGLLFASWCNVKLSYDTLIRLAVVAVTPCVIINTVLVSAGTTFPSAYFIYFMMAMVYLLIGVKATADEIAKQHQAQPPEQNEAI